MATLQIPGASPLGLKFQPSSLLPTSTQSEPIATSLNWPAPTTTKPSATWTPPVTTPTTGDTWPGQKQPIIGSADDILKGLLGGGSTKGTGAGNSWAGKSPRDIFDQISKTLAPTSQSLDQLIEAWKSAGYTAQRATRAGGLLSDDKVILNGQMIDLINDVGGPNASWSWTGVDGSGGGGMDAASTSALLSSLFGGSSFSDPDTARLLEFINQRFAGLTGPLDQGSFPQLQAAAQGLASNLQQPWTNPNSASTQETLKAILQQVSGDPYTSDQWAALRAQAYDELTKSRDQDVRTTLARLAALGHGKGSGTIAEAIRNVETGYQSNKAAEDRALQIAAIQQGNQNRDTSITVSNLLRQIPLEDQQYTDQRASTAVQVLSSLVNAEAQRRQEQEQRLSTATTLLGVPVQLADQRLAQALQVLGLTSGSLDPQSILQVLGSLANSAEATSLNEQQANAALWGQIGAVLAGGG